MPGPSAIASPRSQAAADPPRGHSRLARSHAPTDHPGIFATPGGESGHQVAVRALPMASFAIVEFRSSGPLLRRFGGAVRETA